MQKLVGGGASFVSSAANLLDLPGSIVRDVIGGQGLLGSIDQVISPFSPENRLTGRDLLRKWGAVGPQDNWGNWAAGTGLEIATDPLTFLTQPLSAGGKLARATGLLSKVGQKAGTSTIPGVVGKRTGMFKSNLGSLMQTADEAVAVQNAAAKMGIPLTSTSDVFTQPLRSHLIGFGNPFTGKTAFGIGKAGGKLAENAAWGADILGAVAKASPPGRAARALFDYSVKGFMDPAKQELASVATGLEKAGKWQSNKKIVAAVETMREAYDAFSQSYGTRHSALNDKRIMNVFERGTRLLAERGPADVIKRFRVTAAEVQEMEKVAKEMVSLNDEIWGTVGKKGGNAPLLSDVNDDVMMGAAEHFHRYVDKKRYARGASREKQLLREMMGFMKYRVTPSKVSSSLPRTKETRRIATETINQMLLDKKARVSNLDQAAMHIRDNYLRTTVHWRPKGMGEWEHAKALAKWVRSHPRQRLYTRNVLEDFATYQENAHRLNASLDAIHQFFRENLSGQGVSVRDAFKGAGLNEQEAISHFSDMTGMALPDVENLMVPPDIAAAAKALLDARPSTEWGKAVGGFFDRVTRTFKASVTLPWPAYLSRNFVSGQFTNVTSGLIHGVKDLFDYAKEVDQSARLAFGGDQATLTELMVHQVVDPTRTFADQDLRAFGQYSMESEGVAKYLRDPFGLRPRNPFDVKGSAKQASLKVEDEPLARDIVPGMKGARKAVNTVFTMGGRANYIVEWQNRVPMYLYLRKKGWTPEAAAKKVEELHINYSDLSPFEKTYARRAIPFYAFTRKMAPVILKNLMERPGGLMGRTINVSGRSREADELLPEYVSSQAAIPMKQLPDGTDSYITGFGFPHEDLFSFLQIGGGPGGFARNLGLETGSRLNPLIKLPLEWSTGQTFFQRGPLGGRPLEDLDPTYSRLIQNVKDLASGEKTPRVDPLLGSQGLEMILSNLPTTRVGTSARAWTDPRKWEDPAALLSNMLTGVRMTHVSPAARDAVAQEAAGEFMRLFLGGRKFTKTYIPTDEIEKMPRNEQAMAIKFNQFMNTLRKRREERNPKPKKKN